MKNGMVMVRIFTVKGDADCLCHGMRIESGGILCLLGEHGEIIRAITSGYWTEASVLMPEK